MTAVNSNLDDYANARLGIFFPGYPNSLTGQCVSLNKWVLAEMTDVPNPQAARGNAKDYGDTLVAQGHAIKVPANERKRGDFVVWKDDGGGYGHIGALLSGDRVFEENVGIAGSKRGVFEGIVVYASRIDPLYTNWRKGQPTFYRIKTYVENKEDIVKPNQEQVVNTFTKYLGQPPKDQSQIDYYLNNDIRQLYSDILGTTAPTADEVNSAFNELAPDIEDPNKIAYYTQNPKATLYKNLAGAVKQRLDQEKAKPPKEVEVIKEVIKEVPVEVIKEVPVEVIKEVVKGDDERSLGDLLSAAFKKLFKIK